MQLIFMPLTVPVKILCFLAARPFVWRHVVITISREWLDQSL